MNNVNYCWCLKKFALFDFLIRRRMGCVNYCERTQKIMLFIKAIFGFDQYVQIQFSSNDKHADKINI